MMLLFSILSSSLVFIIFRWFEKWGIDNLPAIIINYFIAAILGLTISDVQSFSHLTPSNGLPLLLIGFLFIVMFNTMAKTSQMLGVGVTSIFVKLSVVLPVIFGVVYLQESLNFTKILGILLALNAITLAGDLSNLGFKKNIQRPLILFFGTGTIDVLMSYEMSLGWNDNDTSILAALLFSIAGILGLFYLFLFKNGIKELNKKNILGGILLGIPNFGTVYFLLRALRSDSLESSLVFPINNTGIILLSSLLGVLFFREKLTLKVKYGLILAIGSILILQL